MVGKYYLYNILRQTKRASVSESVTSEVDLSEEEPSIASSVHEKKQKVEINNKVKFKFS